MDRTYAIATIVLLMLLVIFTVALIQIGCIHFVQPAVDAEVTAAMLRLGTRHGAERIFAKNPEVGGYLCPIVTESILPGLQGECADIELKNQALFVLSAAAKEWFPDWEQDAADIVRALDALFDPELGCTHEQMLYLRAFFQGIADACR